MVGLALVIQTRHTYKNAEGGKEENKKKHTLQDKRKIKSRKKKKIPAKVLKCYLTSSDDSKPFIYLLLDRMKRRIQIPGS